jgi:hypothetical protein
LVARRKDGVLVETNGSWGQNVHDRAKRSFAFTVELAELSIAFEHYLSCNGAAALSLNSGLRLILTTKSVA